MGYRDNQLRVWADRPGGPPRYPGLPPEPPSRRAVAVKLDVPKPAWKLVFAPASAGASAPPSAQVLTPFHSLAAVAVHHAADDRDATVYAVAGAMVDTAGGGARAESVTVLPPGDEWLGLALRCARDPRSLPPDALEAKLAKLATSGGGKFVVAAFGSSVTAGHDGFGHTAWPAVLGRRLSKELEPLGIEVEVRNQAVGGAEPFPRSLCVGPIAGSDVDLVIREWEYWGFSDGLEAPGAHGGEEGAIEIFLRTAFLLPNKPAVLFLNMEPNGEGRKTQQVRAAMKGKPVSYTHLTLPTKA